MSKLAQLMEQYEAIGRLRRESRGLLDGGLGQSSLQVLTNYLVKGTKDTMDVVRETKDTMEAEENKAKLKLTAKMGFYSPNQLTKGSDPYERKKMLLEMKNFPRKINPKGVKGQVEWFLEMESLMQSMLHLAGSSTELSYMVFEPELIAVIINKFPLHITLDLARIKGFRKEKFEKVLEKIAELRSNYEETKDYIDLVERENVEDYPEYEGSTVDNEESLEHESDMFEVK